MSQSPKAAKRPVKEYPPDHPLSIYQAAIDSGYAVDGSSNAQGWVWNDQYIVDDFSSLKGPPSSITDTLPQLQAFYMIYFGEITKCSNVGALFCQIIARSKSFTSQQGDLLTFSPTGEIAVVSYTVPKDLPAVMERFLQSDEDQEVSIDVEETVIPPPREEIRSRIVGEGAEAPPFTQVPVGLNERGVPRDVNLEDARRFKEYIKVAFREIIGMEKETPATFESLKTLTLTAVFLILVMMRRITKRADDLVLAFGRGNIHRHYQDMVPDHFGDVLPAPSPILNRSLDHELSVRCEAGRHLGVMVLYLYWTCALDSTDQPVGMLNQQDQGLEAVLKATCMTHIAGSGLPLATLYTAVKVLYGLDNKTAIRWLSYPELLPSVWKVAKLWARQGELITAKNIMSVKLFPYCRLVHQKYHAELSSRGNENTCYLVACLIDLKSTPEGGTGGAKAALWTASMNPNLKSQIEAAANKIFDTAEGFKLTATEEGQIEFGTTKSQDKSGTTWVSPPKPSEPVHHRDFENDSDCDDYVVDTGM